MTDARHQQRSKNVQEQLVQIQHLLEQPVADEGSLLPDSSSSEVRPEADVHANSELIGKLNQLHSADIAYILEALPLKQRHLLWELTEAERDGEILLSVTKAVRESLIATMNHNELCIAVAQLDANEIADLAPDLPSAVMRDIFKLLSIKKREQLRSAVSSPDDSVSALMSFDMITIRENVTLAVVLRYLRHFEEFPDHAAPLFVVDRDDIFKGVLPISKILLNEPGQKVQQLMIRETLTLHPDDKAQQAVQLFERYDLASVPVIDADGKLLGCVPVGAIVDFIRKKSDTESLNQAGLLQKEDIFASVWKSVQNRWRWLVLNLCIAFIASRVISNFENTIEKLVALAALMPIITGIASNSGNQTINIMLRSLALGQIDQANKKQLLVKELSISGLNGIFFGSIAGIFAYLLYQRFSLSLMFAFAILLNLLLGALAGMAIPSIMQGIGRNPNFGAGILLTTITNIGGLFIFLGLASLFLL